MILERAARNGAWLWLELYQKCQQRKPQLQMHRRLFFFYEVEYAFWLEWAKKFPFSYQSKDPGKTALPLPLLMALVLLLKSGAIHVAACQLCRVPQTILYPSSQRISEWQLPFLD